MKITATNGFNSNSIKRVRLELESESYSLFDKEIIFKEESSKGLTQTNLLDYDARILELHSMKFVIRPKLTAMDSNNKFFTALGSFGDNDDLQSVKVLFEMLSSRLTQR